MTGDKDDFQLLALMLTSAYVMLFSITSIALVAAGVSFWCAAKLYARTRREQ